MKNFIEQISIQFGDLY